MKRYDSPWHHTQLQPPVLHVTLKPCTAPHREKHIRCSLAAQTSLFGDSKSIHVSKVRERPDCARSSDITCVCNGTFQLRPVLPATLDKARSHALQPCEVDMRILIGVVLLLQLPLVILYSIPLHCHQEVPGRVDRVLKGPKAVDLLASARFIQHGSLTGQYAH